jgi:hypothetical protein
MKSKQNEGSIVPSDPKIEKYVAPAIPIINQLSRDKLELELKAFEESIKDKDLERIVEVIILSLTTILSIISSNQIMIFTYDAKIPILFLTIGALGVYSFSKVNRYWKTNKVSKEDILTNIGAKES